MNEDWLKLIVQFKKRYSILSEILDLTEQMFDALLRDDEVSFSMLLSMRQEPILRMEESDNIILQVKETFSNDMLVRIESLDKSDLPKTQEETLYKQQIEQNKRLIDKILILDKRVLTSLKKKR